MFNFKAEGNNPKEFSGLYYTLFKKKIQRTVR